MKAIHYINQFYGQIGGEEKAGHPLEVRETVVGPGVALQAILKGQVEIVATIICGDNYLNENLELAKSQIAQVLKDYEPDLVIAGPGFNAGRYGMACGTACKIANEMGIPAVSGLYQENPAVEIYKSHAYIAKTKNSAADMRNAVAHMCRIIKKLITDPQSLDPEVDDYYTRGIRIAYWEKEVAAVRAVDMLIAKLKGEPFKTELEKPTYKKVDPAPPVEDVRKAKIALITTGGYVPIGNPDRIEACMATKHGKYPYSMYGSATELNGIVVHGGYDPVATNENGHRMVPSDVLYEMAQSGEIGQLCDFLYVTSGNGAIGKNSVRFGAEMAQDLLAEGVDAAILTSA